MCEDIESRLPKIKENMKEIETDEIKRKERENEFIR